LRLEKYPDNQTAMQALEEGIAKRYACIIGANCTARYSGRAESYLEDGDRIIFIKPDTTILLHQHAGSQPVNWMPGNTVHNVKEENGKVVLVSGRISPPEKLTIEMSKIHFINRHVEHDL
jgi:RecB family endonuclease NucS